MSLLKIPLLLSSTIAEHIASTPPHNPSRNEVVHQTFNQWISMNDFKWGLPLSKAIAWTVSLTEIAITISHAIDPSTLPSAVMQQAARSLRNIQEIPITSTLLYGTALTVTGGFIRWWCFRTLGRFFTFKLSVREGHRLVTSGPYAVVRHPSYMGGIIMSIGVATLHGSPTSLLRRSGVLNIPGVKTVAWAWLVWKILSVSSHVGRINQEEEVLKSMAGDEWQRWARVVRYKLIPGIY